MQTLTKSPSPAGWEASAQRSIAQEPGATAHDGCGDNRDGQPRDDAPSIPYPRARHGSRSSTHLLHPSSLPNLAGKF